MSEIITLRLDLAQNMFQAHGADASGRAVLRKKLRRDQAIAIVEDPESGLPVDAIASRCWLRRSSASGRRSET